MPLEYDITVSPEIAGDQSRLRDHVASITNVPVSEWQHLAIIRRSYDARGRRVRVHLKVRICRKDDPLPNPPALPDYPDVREAEEVVIAGAGPAGLFAALRLIEKGMKPVILERGKDVRERIRDIRAINVRHEVNEDSNYCFGEGGAGAYSDGKLYTRSVKRGNVRAVLEKLVAFGASPEILVDAHPHIGTNKLPGIIANIRNFIRHQGGEIHFNARVVDLTIRSGEVHGVGLMDGTRRPARRVILATGHSARDVFEMLHRQGIALECKPFALGVRVEHDQRLIDRIQYSCHDRGKYLPPASYRIVRQIGGRGVYSFCMCPGGVIAPCATRPGEIVTNGWSSSRRARSTANSGIVVELRMEDFKKFEDKGPLAAMFFQQSVEQKAWELGGKTQAAPAQRMEDFVRRRISATLPKTSYAPGVTPADLHEVLPERVAHALADGFRAFGKMMRGFYTNEATLHAPESRTSSPVRIPRHPDTLEHVGIQGLYPCGEGAGYSGGIVSAALDGERVAEKIEETR